MDTTARQLNLQRKTSVSSENVFELLNCSWHFEYSIRALPYLLATDWAMSGHLLLQHGKS